MKEIVINVKGMACGGCENRIQNALKTIEGIETVVANHNNGTVRVTAKEEVSLNTIKEKIEDIGFEVIEEN